jgi:ADP-dependent NAD(P)H-hydrate dehydratase / NAD(P)H-hydrate epimerase
MLILLTSEQTRQADRFTITAKKITSLDLMESAAVAFVSVFKGYYIFRDIHISIYCGTGNNGGDGLAIARLLKEQGYDRLSVKVAWFSESVTEDFRSNLERLALTGIEINYISITEEFPVDDAEILIDALLGSGLSRPLDGDFAKLVRHLNTLGKTIVSVDVPTGFPTEGPIDTESTIVNAKLVISFQRPKINFFFPESASFIKRFRFVDIGLDEPFIQSQTGGWKLLESEDVRQVIRSREAFSHKGTFGHALIIAGSRETMGAALLCVDACLHSGAGLTTASIPVEGLSALNSSVPEAMASIRSEAEDEKVDIQRYQAIAIGPGLGNQEAQVKLVRHILINISVPLVLDADALNILSRYPDLIGKLPRKTILTPHVKEFDRLFGAHRNWWERIATARAIAAKHEIIIVLKNQYTFIILPDSNVIINPTGNPAMATGGMGDVLTGMIASLLAQGYSAEEAALASCYLHGKAGDLLKEKSGMLCIPPRYLIRKLPEVIGSYSGG